MIHAIYILTVLTIFICNLMLKEAKIISLEIQYSILR